MHPACRVRNTRSTGDLEATSFEDRSGVYSTLALTVAALAADPLPPDATISAASTLPFSAVKANDGAHKREVMQRQSTTLGERYDLANRPIQRVMMSGGQKPVQAGVRVKLASGVTWDHLALMSPDDIKARGLLPEGFKPLPHVKQATGGRCFRTIRSIRSQSSSSAIPAPVRCEFRSARSPDT